MMFEGPDIPDRECWTIITGGAGVAIRIKIIRTYINWTITLIKTYKDNLKKHEFDYMKIS